MPPFPAGRALFPRLANACLRVAVLRRGNAPVEVQMVGQADDVESGFLAGRDFVVYCLRIVSVRRVTGVHVQVNTHKSPSFSLECKRGFDEARQNDEHHAGVAEHGTHIRCARPCSQVCFFLPRTRKTVPRTTMTSQNTPSAMSLRGLSGRTLGTTAPKKFITICSATGKRSIPVR